MTEPLSHSILAVGMDGGPALWSLAADIVDSDGVITCFASTEWDELNDDGKAWAAAIVAETIKRTNSDMRSVIIDVAASLAAAISLLEKGGKAAKKAAPSDKMFDQMLRDYRASLDRARSAIKAEARHD